MDLAAEGISIVAGRQILLEDIDLALQTGTLTVLLGANGAGKSSLLRTLAGASRPSRGHVYLGGEEISKVSPIARARKISYLPQTFQSPFAFTVRELLKLAAQKEVSENHPALQALELERFLDRPLSTLSGGERQRAAVARALISDAGVVLLDEPTAHLDPRYALRLMRYLKEKAEGGATICLASHELALVVPFATHLILLGSRKLLFHGAAGQLTPEALSTSLGLEGNLGQETDGRLYLTFP